MKQPKPFQVCTIAAAFAALTGSGSRRFLVADEVGLGKTVIAQQVIRRMIGHHERRLCVLYVCSNLAIARQNRESLLDVVGSGKEVRQSAICTVDRLTLVPANEPPSNGELHLYTLTPDTSIPMRGGKRRDGHKAERALLHALVDASWPSVFDHLGKDVFKGQAQKSWRNELKLAQKQIGAAGLQDAFRQSLRTELALEPGQWVPTALRRFKDAGQRDWKLRLIAKLRNALAAAALEQIEPDLVIFDEFQRFRDLVHTAQNDDPSRRVLERLRGETGNHPAALLLLSATPYRLFSKRWEDEGGTSHQAEFFELVEFLYGSKHAAKVKTKECREAFAQLADRLRSGELGEDEVGPARECIERLLRPIMARTERASQEHGWVDFQTTSKDAPLGPGDLTVFRHLVESFQERDRPSAVHYWKSIPLPMQTMGPRYQAWKNAHPRSANDVAHLTEWQRNRWGGPTHWPNAKLRALMELVPTSQLILPWQAPSMPWWPLDGLWGGATGSTSANGKLLVFSHFRATPPVVAGLLSYELERRLLEGRDITWNKLSARRLLQPSKTTRALLAQFHPSPWLIRTFDPLVVTDRHPQALLRAAEERLRADLGALGIAIRASRSRRPLAAVLGAVERRRGDAQEVLGAWEGMARTLGSQDSENVGLLSRVREWAEESHIELDHVTETELADLAELAVSGPGVVIGRALHRHWPDALNHETGGFKSTVEAAWSGLRNYLARQLFYVALRSEGEDQYPAAIQRAIVDGNLESVIDEHLWITQQLRSLRGKDLVDDLIQALRIRTSVLWLRRPDDHGSGHFSLRCHAALPFTDAQTTSEIGHDGEEGRLRSDELRRAFNTPFWPHVLATTSVGQEGLDFHVWCHRLLHWDLCGNPVDLEQREGRIQRYGGLSIRRAIVELLERAGVDPLGGIGSPWERIGRLADERLADASGLSPWWVCEGARIERYVLQMPSSREAQQLARLKEQRLLYRLVLGQPNQEDLMEVLQRRANVDPREARRAAVSLSPYFDRRTARRGV